MNGRPGMMLGKLAPKVNKKTLMFSKYLRGTPPPIPPVKLWREYKVDQSNWGMYGNDTIGDCTCAEVAHMLMLVTAHTGSIVVPPTADVIAMYSAITGYDPATGANDNGAAISDVLNYWQTTGLSGHKILGWVQMDQTNLTAVKQAIYLFGGVDLGVNLPNSAMDQTNANETWDVVADDGGIDGGHSIPLFGYGSVGTNCVTWGQRQEMTWEWFSKYCDECYAVITQDWINKASGLAVNMLNIEELNADLQELRAA